MSDFAKNRGDFFSPEDAVEAERLLVPFPAAGKAYEDGYLKGYADGLAAQPKALPGNQHGLAKAHYLALKDQLEADHFDDYATVGAVSGSYVVAPSRVAAVHAFRRQHGDEVAWTFHIGTTR
jgi:hypothetical protein